MKCDYDLLDCGDEKKLERFGPYTLIRPSPQAFWSPQDSDIWKNHHGEFTRREGGVWKKRKCPASWNIQFHSLKLKLAPTDFGHLGLFPEHAHHWEWMVNHLRKPSKVLNLFAYSGAATLFLAQQGHAVCHVDASKGMVDWAKENRDLNGLENAPIRWIVDDVMKFLRREVRRGNKYDAILLDPPTYGRGSQGQVFKIEKEIAPLLGLCQELASEAFAFLLFTAHTPGFTPMIQEILLNRINQGGKIESGEMLLSGRVNLPSGTYARWRHV